MRLYSAKLLRHTISLLWICCFVLAQNYNFERLVPDVLNAVFTSRAIEELSKAGCNITESFRLNSDLPTIDNVFFQLRTPCKAVTYAMSQAEELATVPEFDAINKQTVVFVTGWNASPNEPYVKEMEKAYHCRGGYNFLVVDASRFLSAINYGEAAQNVVNIGKAIAYGLVGLRVHPNNIHLIGHSLGAHVVGNAGHYFTRMTGLSLDHITGLDPAKPCFDTIRQLSAKDATFVDIIHSNPHVLGIGDTIGHADYYPYGLSATHPGCESPLNMCSHNLAITYYSRSVHPGHEFEFMTTKCDSEFNLYIHYCNGQKVPMGFAVHRNERGIFLAVDEEKDPSKIKVDTTCGMCRRVYRRPWYMWN